jgi:putative sigma-54 modulation protein
LKEGLKFIYLNGGNSVEVSVTSRHIEITDEIRDYVQRKADKLPRFYSRIHEIEFIFDQESEQISAEMIVRAGHKHTFVAAEVGPDPFALVDLIVDKVERQLKKQKDKEKDHNPREVRQDLNEGD